MPRTKASAPKRRASAAEERQQEVGTSGASAAPTKRKRSRPKAHDADSGGTFTHFFGNPGETTTSLVLDGSEKDSFDSSSFRFDLVRVEEVVELRRSEGGEGAGPRHGGNGGHRYSLDLVVKPNRLYKRKRMTGDTTCLQCVVTDTVEGRTGVCTASGVVGSYSEVQNVLMCVLRGIMVPVDARLEPVDDTKAKLSFCISLREAVLEMTRPGAYDKPSQRHRQALSELAPALMFLRPDFFDVPAPSLATADAGVPEGDHLELASHIVGQGSEQINTALLYAAIAPQRLDRSPSSSSLQPSPPGLQVPGLVPSLRSYQTRAVQWMLRREACYGELQEEDAVWRPVKDLRGRKEVYLNLCTGQVSSKGFPRGFKVPGGILADEMGLGKTVELMACILSNRCPSETKEEPKAEAKVVALGAAGGAVVAEVKANGKGKAARDDAFVKCGDCSCWLDLRDTGRRRVADLPGDYVCGECVRRRAMDASLLQRQCKTTLIICPDPILDQWQEELQRHAEPGALRVFTYGGQSEALSTGGSPRDIVTAATLATYDVVLCTYGTLGAEIHKDADVAESADENQKRLRHAKRYQKVPTPLTRLCFWRVCLDEAQMVQSGTAKCAQMALKLTTRYRWCVTGTPINKGLEDLYGLMVFLGAHPFDYRYWWNALVQQSCDSGSTRGFANLTRLLQPSSGGIMWRTRKVDVKEDLDLRPQTVSITSLDLSEVERHFYKQQHQECYEAAVAALPRGAITGAAGESDPDRPLGPRAAAKIFAKLLRLRQACCHPQVGSQGIKSLSHKRLSMEEILDMMIEKAKVDAEDTLRVVIFCLNGLASVFQLEGNDRGAVEAYREALKVSKDHLHMGIKTDSLQRLHTLHNLSELLRRGVDGVAPTLRDSTLADEARELKQKYVGAASSNLVLAGAEFSAKRDKVSCGSDLEVFGGNWWVQVLTQIELGDEGGRASFVGQVKSMLGDRYAAGAGSAGRNSSSMVHKFTDVGGLKYLLGEELRAIREARRTCVAEIARLESECQHESRAFIQEVSTCGKCRGELGTSRHRCAYCGLDDLLMRYEARIFSLRTQGTKRGAVLSAEDAAAAQEAAGGMAGGWGRMAGRSVGGGGDGADPSADLGRGARGRTGRNAVAHAEVFHAPSETEVVLEYLAALASRGKVAEMLDGRLDQDAAKSHLAMLEGMRSEFKPARAYANAQRQYVYSFDELEMAMMRMQLRAPGEVLQHDHEKYFKIYEAELVVRNKELSDEKVVANADLSKATGTLRYLEGLARRGRELGGEGCLCPVCREDIVGQRAVLSCGHLFCRRCVLALIARTRGGRRQDRKIQCPTCRTPILVGSEIAYCGAALPEEDEGEGEDEGKVEVEVGGEPGVAAIAPEGRDGSSFDSDEVAVEGSYGSKLEAVVRRTKSILLADPKAKLLVFSEWQDVLELLSSALSENGVRHAFAKGRPAMAKALRHFKGKCAVEMSASVLMLPVKLGANGLNLVEAQHVILIEPLLDPAKEAQAFGRVDRIGQTKQTYVHRFIVSKTVEERVYQLAQQRSREYGVIGAPGASRSKEGVREMSSLTVGDVRDLLQQYK